MKSRGKLLEGGPCCPSKDPNSDWSSPTHGLPQAINDHGFPTREWDTDWPRSITLSPVKAALAGGWSAHHSACALGGEPLGMKTNSTFRADRGSLLSAVGELHSSRLLECSKIKVKQVLKIIIRCNSPNLATKELDQLREGRAFTCESLFEAQN